MELGINYLLLNIPVSHGATKFTLKPDLKDRIARDLMSPKSCTDVSNGKFLNTVAKRHTACFAVA